jgi:hypothetical protein
MKKVTLGIVSGVTSHSFLFHLSEEPVQLRMPKKELPSVFLFHSLGEVPISNGVCYRTVSLPCIGPAIIGMCCRSCMTLLQELKDGNYRMCARQSVSVFRTFATLQTIASYSLLIFKCSMAPENVQ